MMRELQVTSSLDGSDEKVLFSASGLKKEVPLVVILHSWSADRFNQARQEFECLKRGWHLLLPEFRGPNLTTNPRATQACASELAQQDILDAVAFVRENYPISEQIFLLGGSGGGHMSLMMAARAPELWTAVSSWCPITDLRQWRLQNEHYRPHIEACCGGVPDDGDDIVAQYSARSPVDHFERISQANVSIHHGKNDRSVPVTHTWNLYQKIIETGNDSTVYADFFDGGHDCHVPRAFSWFDGLAGKVTQNSEITS